MSPELNLPAIAFFSATGFFPGESTYFKNKAYRYSESSSFAEAFNNFANFKWYYNPVDISLAEATDNFASVFEGIIKRQSGSAHVILPLSGGLDSRTQAAALSRLGIKTSAFSYSFKNGHHEDWYGKKIADACGFDFTPYIVPKGYLWNCIDELAHINSCYSDFTHPRQMAFVDAFSKLGDTFSLGHWGDVLFDGMNVDSDLDFDQQVKAIIYKITRKGGLQLAETLWQEWDLEGTFTDYLQSTVTDMHRVTYISENANASVRAFKSKYWATRWTASNFSIFEKTKPISVPYFDIEMCNFVCQLPESLLNGRQIQIEYIKKYAPDLARIKWQSQRPYNLFNYHLNKPPLNLPYRLISKSSRILNEFIGKKLIQRNWELQFIGVENRNKLKYSICGNTTIGQIVSDGTVQRFINNFYNQPTPATAHQLGILLTLSKFSTINFK